MIRESISAGITVIGLLVVGLATLAIWLHEHYAQGAIEDIVPILVALVFFFGSLVIALMLLHFSATQFMDENAVQIVGSEHKLFMVLYGVTGHMVVVGLLVLLCFFGFCFRLEQLRPEQDSRGPVSTSTRLDHGKNNDSTSQRSDSAKKSSTHLEEK